MSATELVRQIPSVSDLLLRSDVVELLNRYPRDLVLQFIREITNRLRSQADQHTERSFANAVAALADDVQQAIAAQYNPSLRPVINATGVLLHTNLGRAPLGQRALQHVTDVASGYCNLELDLESGRRGQRDRHAESKLLRLLELRNVSRPSLSCAVVNNCAAATFLVLNTIASGRDVIVSRGELVEIGGGFRVPEILAKSGARLKEVGTTNRTRIADYEAAIDEQTGLILRVHQSNFRIEGFTERPALEGLVELCGGRGIPLFEDQGTGCLVQLADYGVPGESSLLESVASGANLVTASGDKLLGGPQCGLIFGDSGLIRDVHQNPLSRAFRVDKLTYAALEGTLIDYLQGAFDAIPTLQMLMLDAESIRARCEAVASAVDRNEMDATIAKTVSIIGGGTTPGAELESYAAAIHHKRHSAESFSRLLRQAAPAVVVRIKDDEILLDLRTVPPEADAILTRQLNRVA